jgi:4'-phosphopantetheinyl transferase
MEYFKYIASKLNKYFIKLPLILEENINTTTLIGVWHCTESLGELEAEEELPILDLEEIKNTGIHKRKIEKFIARILTKYLLQKYFDTPYQGLMKLETGKPVLVNCNFEVSVSHCQNYLTVLLTKKDKAGIDLQNVDEKIAVVAPRIFSEQELNQIGDDTYLMARAWSAKEAMFKYYEKGSINFKRDLHLKNIADPANFSGVFTCGEEGCEVDFGLIKLGKTYQIVYCLEKEHA